MLKKFVLLILLFLLQLLKLFTSMFHYLTLHLLRCILLPTAIYSTSSVDRNRINHFKILQMSYSTIICLLLESQCFPFLNKLNSIPFVVSPGGVQMSESFPVASVAFAATCQGSKLNHCQGFGWLMWQRSPHIQSFFGKHEIETPRKLPPARVMKKKFIFQKEFLL